MISNTETKIEKQSKELKQLRQKVDMYENFIDRVTNVEYDENYAYITVEKALDGSVGIPLKSNTSEADVATFNPKDFS